jgi:enoyl-CoA hydratase/carnithine racemase
MYDGVGAAGQDQPVNDWTHFSVTAETDRLWRVTFDNPPINLVTPEMVAELPQLIDQMETAPELRVVVFESANPDYFLNHYDTSRVAETPKDLGVTGYPLVIDINVRLSRLPVVSIAKIHGRLRGVGNEFTQAMDMRFASHLALLGQPETANGNLPGGGGLEHLPRLLGRARALEVALSSDDYPGELAERYGWSTAPSQTATSTSWWTRWPGGSRHSTRSPSPRSSSRSTGTPCRLRTTSNRRPTSTSSPSVGPVPGEGFPLHWLLGAIRPVTTRCASATTWATRKKDKLAEAHQRLSVPHARMSP